MTAIEQIRKQHLDLHSRLHSIAHDANFVRSVHEAYPDIPVVKNLRCGAWYTDPDFSSPHSAYFKSTDGHYGCWSFNLRRPNLHILSVASHKGIILVDSTRAGKRIPDALSKTVPIWCAVVNRAVKRRKDASNPVSVVDNDPWTAFYTPPGAVSKQEHSQIEREIDKWVDSLLTSAYDLKDLEFPLRPFWITPSTCNFPELLKTCTPIICVSASAVIDDAQLRRTFGFVYVQGSGDDHELWGQGLTPDMFWENRGHLLTADRDDLPELVSSIVVQSSGKSSSTSTIVPIKRVANRIAYLDRTLTPEDAERNCYSFVVIRSSPPYPRDKQTAVKPSVQADDMQTDDVASMHTHTTCLPRGKKAYKALFSSVLSSVLRYIRVQLSFGRSICIAADEPDVGVAILVSVLQLFFASDGTMLDLSPDQITDSFQFDAPSKQSLRTRLHWIIADCPGINPSRAILKRVNEYILSSDWKGVDVVGIRKQPGD